MYKNKIGDISKYFYIFKKEDGKETPHSRNAYVKGRTSSNKQRTC